MDLDDLQQVWSRFVPAQAHLDDARRALRRTRAGEVAQLLGWLALVMVAGSFWISHRASPALLIAGLVMHAYGLLAIGVGVLQLLLLARVDHAQPIVQMQIQLAALRRFRVRSSLALGLPWWLLWVPCAMIGASLLWGIELPAAWLGASLAVGVIGLIASIGLARRLAGRLAGSPRLARWTDDLAGHSLARATRALDDAARFAQE